MFTKVKEMKDKRKQEKELGKELEKQLEKQQEKEFEKEKETETSKEKTTIDHGKGPFLYYVKVKGWVGGIAKYLLFLTGVGGWFWIILT